MRIGQGFDSHQWDDDLSKPLILGGVKFDSDSSLKGHSDGDVIIHACIDALLGAAGLGDIGVLFPDNDPAYENFDNSELLKIVVSKLHDENWEVINVDCSVIAEQPKISSRKSEIESKISKILGAPFSVKGKHPEGLDSLNGVMCLAVSLIQERDE